MRLVLDTCVLYPTAMRGLLMGAARLGVFQPLWSQRIMGEWYYAAARHGGTSAAMAEAEIAVLRDAWPGAEVPVKAGLEARLSLPDPADVHVLAAAIASSADGIVTMNAKDFPRNVLSEEGVIRIDPDALLMDALDHDPDGMRQIAEAVLAEANRLSGRSWEMRPLMKKARLPRFGKALVS
ncbi:RSP_2648 family PIN domain-containing protein [Chachezhania antarctica]|uniref:RSP_2648 family PIN domain-containing protein n=1 Tax=Chachezhania antarctica TaxID=2340860 RepID=UPI000EAD7F52|nr:PIN domain-containing protein [Chachezhania antarctica]